MQWIRAKDRLPEKMGRYLILVTFQIPVKVNEKICRRDIPFVNNFDPKKGWRGLTDEMVVTDWMEIPIKRGIQNE